MRSRWRAAVGGLMGFLGFGAIAILLWYTSHEVIAGPLDLSQVASWPGQLPRFGEWAVGTAIVAVAFVVLARIGVGRWEAWDLVARRAARKPVPKRSSRLVPTIQLGLRGPLLSQGDGVPMLEVLEEITPEAARLHQRRPRLGPHARSMSSTRQ